MKLTYNLLVLLAVIVTIGCSSQQAQLVSPGGVVTVQNRTGEEIEVFVDGARFEVIEPGDDATLDKIISGMRLLSAKGVDSGLSREREFDLALGEAQTWLVEPLATTGDDGTPSGAQCALDVANTLDTDISVEFPGVEPRTVSAGTTVRINGFYPGVVHAIAHIPTTGATFAMDMNLKPGVVPAFTVSLANGAVRITNHSGRRAVINTASFAPRVLDDGNSAVFDGLPSGQVDFAVVDLANRPLAGFKADAVPGQVIDLVVNRPLGVLKVVSDLDIDVSIYADGILMGTCAARGGATIQGLITGRNHLRAVDPAGDTVASTWLEGGSEPALWLLGAGGVSNLREGTGAIKIINPSREAIQVFIDGCSMGTVAAGGNRVYPDMEPGTHQVTTIGVESESFATAQFSVTEGRALAWKANLPGASLAVRNTLDADVSVYVDGRQVGSVNAQSNGVFRVPEGPHRVDISGASSSITRNISLPARAVTTIVFSSQFVTLVATNQFTDPVEVRVDERILGVLNPGERVTVSDVRPGSVRLTATSTLRPINMTTTISLDAGDAFDWFINP